MNLLLWTTRVEPEHLTLLRTLSDIGYDIVEIPVFDIDEIDRYETLGRHIRELGMQPLARISHRGGFRLLRAPVLAKLVDGGEAGASGGDRRRGGGPAW